MDLIRLGTVAAMIATSISTTALSADDVRSKLTVLKQKGDLGLLMCSMKIETAALQFQLSPSQMSRTNILHAQSGCAHDEIEKLTPEILVIKDILKDKPASLPILKDWYAKWTSTIENMPASSIADNLDTSDLDKIIDRLIIEETW
jgi:hypothetical protein